MKTSLPDQIIDFHVHLFPDPLFDAIWNFFSTQYKWQIIHKFYQQQTIDHLRRHGVSHIVYSNYAHKEGIAESLNAWNIDLLDRNEKIYCFAAFHPGDQNAIQMAEKMLDHPKVVGFKLQLLVQNFYPDDKRLYPLYEMVIEKKKRILFHVGTGPTGNAYVGFKYFLPLMQRYPQLPATIAHLGGYEFEPFFDLLNDHENLMMDTAFCFYRDSVMHFDLPISYLEDNRDRLLYGSDFPNLIAPREEEIEGLLALKLSDSFYRKLFYENAIQLLSVHCPESQV